MRMGIWPAGSSAQVLLQVPAHPHPGQPKPLQGAREVAAAQVVHVGQRQPPPLMGVGQGEAGM